MKKDASHRAELHWYVKNADRHFIAGNLLSNGRKRREFRHRDGEMGLNYKPRP